MQLVYDRIIRVAPTDVTVLIEGERGTEKEMVAQTIHALSRRQGGPFVAVNCGAVSPQVIESELIGHGRASFSGVAPPRPGYFERAAEGTLLLDEIAEMPVELQARLCHLLEMQHLRRVGAADDIAVDVRVIATTSHLDAGTAEGTLRRDLLDRLHVLPMWLPPLRDRVGDAILLAEYLLAQLNRAESTDKSFDGPARLALRDHAWPGNVRELRDAVHSAFTRAGKEITRACLPPSLRDTKPSAQVPDEDAPLLAVRVGTAIADVEQWLIVATLAACGGRKEETARALGISVKTLHERLRQRSRASPTAAVR
jgi:DNA-binding NtrC family response regulator